MIKQYEEAINTGAPQIEKLQKEIQELKGDKNNQAKTINIIRSEKDQEWEEIIKIAVNVCFDKISGKRILKELNIKED